MAQILNKSGVPMTVTPAGDDTVFELDCIECDQHQKLKIPWDQYQAWRNGALIQVAMPKLSPAERELFLTGICGSCFDKMFRRRK